MATAKIREREGETGGHIPIIGLTARVTKEDVGRCFAVGMDQYLSKPIKSELLYAALAGVGSQAVGIEETTEAIRAAGRIDRVAVLDFMDNDEELLRTMIATWHMRDAVDTITALQDKGFEGDLATARDLYERLVGNIGALNAELENL